MRLQEKRGHCNFVGKGVTQRKECFRKNDLAAMDQKGQRKQEGNRDHDTGLTWGQHSTERTKREGDIKKRNSSLAKLSRANPPKRLM